MAFIYTNPGWTNGGAPAINKTNLDNLSNSLASIGAGGGSSVILADDASKVSGYGIGVLVPDMGSTFAAALLSGNYKYGATTTSAPTTAAGTVIVVAGSVTDEFYAHDNTSFKMYHGYRAHGTGAPTWELVWTPASDGNGGQPPAPKPNIGGGIGQWQANDVASGGAVNVPAGGTWAWLYINAYGLYIGGVSGGIAAGGTNLGNAPANARVLFWRIA